MIDAIRHRLLVEAPAAEAQNRYFTTHEWFPLTTKQSVVYPTHELEEAYLTHFPPAKERKMRHAMDDYHHSGVSRRMCASCPIFVKSDELLVKPSLTFKARTIANVSPLVQCATGPMLREIGERLHRALDGFTVNYRGRYKYRIAWASGLADSQLGSIIKYWQTVPGVGIMIAGDDSLVVRHDNNGVEYWWADASSYDQAQGRSILEWEYKSLAWLGLPASAIEILRWTSRADYRYSSKTLSCRLRMSGRSMRPTGGPDTTLGNSLLMAYAWVNSAEHSPWDTTELIKEFLRQGLKMKLFHSSDLIDADFLKGLFVPTLDNGLTWIPLPGRFIKLGKIMTDPRQLYKTKDLEMACLYHARSLASTYSQYAQVPLLRTFVKKYYQAETPAFKQDLLYHVQGSGEQPTIAGIELLCARHYRVSVDWFLECEEMIDRASLFTFLEHPLFEVLGKRDYE